MSGPVFLPVLIKKGKNPSNHQQEAEVEDRPSFRECPRTSFLNGDGIGTEPEECRESLNECLIQGWKR